VGVLAAGALAAGVLGPGVARAQVTGSFDGGVAVARGASDVNAAASLRQTGQFVTGTMAITAVPADFAGIYALTGKATPKRLKVSGVSATGAVLKWRAKIAPGALSGRAKVKAGRAKLKGLLALTLNVSSGDGSACDAVYQANAAFFADQVVAQALTACTACHVAGGQADATRLRVTAADPLATARSVAMLVDAANPAASRMVTKPLALVPHGGGPQITAGSVEEQILQQWIALVAAAQCG
jgi:hypothetical protein